MSITASIRPSLRFLLGSKTPLSLTTAPPPTKERIKKTLVWVTRRTWDWIEGEENKNPKGEIGTLNRSEIVTHRAP